MKLQDHNGESVSNLREEHVFPPSSCGPAPALSQHLRLTLPRLGLPCAHSQHLMGPDPLLRPPTCCGEGQYAERSKCPWLQSSLFSFLTPCTSCHRPWIGSLCTFFLAHFRMQLELGTPLKASLPSSPNSSRTYPTRGSHTVTLRMRPSEGRWPRNRQEQPRPCFHCLLPGPAAAGHSDLPFQNLPVCIKPAFTSDPRPFSELDFNPQNHYQGCSESG